MDPLQILDETYEDLSMAELFDWDDYEDEMEAHRQAAIRDMDEEDQIALEELCDWDYDEEVLWVG